MLLLLFIIYNQYVNIFLLYFFAYLVFFQISQQEDDISLSDSQESSFNSNSIEEQKDLVNEIKNKRQDLMIGQENLGQLESISDDDQQNIQQDEEDLTSTVIQKQQNIINLEKVDEALKGVEINFTKQNLEKRNDKLGRLSKAQIIEQKRRNEEERRYKQELLQKKKEINKLKLENELIKQQKQQQNAEFIQENQIQENQFQQQFEEMQQVTVNSNAMALFEDDEEKKKIKKQTKVTTNFKKQDQELVTGNPLPLSSFVQNKLYFYLINIQYPNNISAEDANYVDLLGKVIVSRSSQQQLVKIDKSTLTQSCVIRVKDLRKQLLIELNSKALVHFIQEGVNINDQEISQVEFFQKFGTIIKNPGSQVPVKFQQQDIWNSGLLNREKALPIIQEIKQTISQLLDLDIKQIQSRPTIKVQLQDQQQEYKLYLQVLLPGNQKINTNQLIQIKKQSQFIKEIFLENTPIMNYIIERQLQVNSWYTLSSFKQMEVYPQDDDFTKCKIKFAFIIDQNCEIQKQEKITETPDYSKLYINIKRQLNKNIVCISCLFEYQNYKKFYFINDQVQDRTTLIGDGSNEYVCLELQDRYGKFSREYQNVYELQMIKATKNNQYAVALANIFSECQADVVIADNLRQEEQQFINQLTQNIDTETASQYLHFYQFREQKKRYPLQKNTRLTLFSMGQILDFNKLVQELAPDDKELSLEYQARSNQVCEETYSWLTLEEIQYYLKQIREQGFAIRCQCEEVLMMQEICKQFNAVELLAQISHLTFMSLQDTFIYGRAKRNATLLNVVFSNMIFIAPGNLHYSTIQQKQEQQVENEEGRHAQYEGGRVIDPKKGFHTNCIIVLDYNSLYPSIIREYNICYTNIKYIKEQGYGTFQGLRNIDTDNEKDPFKSVLPQVVSYLLQTRKNVKNQIKEESNSANPDQEKIQTLNITQLAFKLISNSMYGCLGFGSSFYQNLILASKITELGRQALGIAEQVVQSNGLTIIYGDTDSIMIDSNINIFDQIQYKKNDTKYMYTHKYKNAKKQVIQLANSLTEEIGKNFTYLKMGLDYIFVRQLLTNKKRYAALKLLDNDQIKLEYKGLDLVRRDWCLISRSIQKNIINKIMFGNESTSGNDVIEYMQSVNNQLSSNDIQQLDWKLFKMTKMLNKQPEQYKDIKGMDHVICARYMQQQQQIVKAGQIIEYLIVKRDYAPQWLRDNFQNQDNLPVPFDYHIQLDRQGKSKLALDINWYVKQQILPPVERIASFIQMLRDGQISQIFGFEQQQQNDENQETQQLFDSILVNMYKDCVGIKVNQNFWPETLEQKSNQYRKTVNLNPQSKGARIHLHPLDWFAAIGGQKYVGSYQQEVINRTLTQIYKMKNNYHICSNSECVFNKLSLDDIYNKEENQCPLCNGVVIQKYKQQQLLKEIFYLLEINDTSQQFYNVSDNYQDKDYSNNESVKNALQKLQETTQFIQQLRNEFNIGYCYISNLIQDVENFEQNQQLVKQLND